MKKPLRALATVGLVTLAAIGFWCLASPGPPASPRLVQSLSPTNQGIAAFVREDTPTAYRIHFFVCDGSRGGEPRRIGAPFVSDRPIRLHDAVWSQDGTVVVLRAVAPATNDRNLCVEGFDFRRHRVIAGRANGDRPALIRHILVRRGGPGKTALASGDAFGHSAMSTGEIRDYDLPAVGVRPVQNRSGKKMLGSEM